MTDRRFCHCMLMALTLFGCSAHVDNLTKFHIKGEVLEQGSDVPVQGAVLSFTDTGFDYVRSKNISAQKIGESENSGKLNVKFAYSWGVNESLFANKPPQTFILSLEHPAYHSMKIPLRASDFPAADHEVQVNIGTVKLTTRAAVTPVR